VLAARAEHEFPFDFTPLLKLEADQKLSYILWVEGYAPAKLRWRTMDGKQAGDSFEVLPASPVSAVEDLVQMLNEPTLAPRDYRITGKPP
jgi:hypothetical protein